LCSTFGIDLAELRQQNAPIPAGEEDHG
jgi:hypothetical protein